MNCSEIVMNGGLPQQAAVIFVSFVNRPVLNYQPVVRRYTRRNNYESCDL